MQFKNISIDNKKYYFYMIFNELLRKALWVL